MALREHVCSWVLASNSLTYITTRLTHTHLQLFYIRSENDVAPVFLLACIVSTLWIGS